MLACVGCRRFVRPGDLACPFCGKTLPTTAAPLAMSLVLGVMLGACGSVVGSDTGASTGTSGSTSTTAGTVTAATTATPTTDDGPPDPSVPTSVSSTAVDTMDATTYADDDISDDEGCAFYGCAPDSGPSSLECDIWAQDCPVGEKCMPWSNDGGSVWNATRCSPIDADPGEPGDPCTVEGSNVSGIDDCGLGTMCWNVDEGTNAGECVAFCQGTVNSPVCEDPANACAVINDGVLILCLPSCMPLVQDCEAGEGCFAVDETFVCLYVDGDGGTAGLGCESINDCDPGLTCASSDTLPDCAGSACCSPYCSLAGGDVPCVDALGPEAACVSWYGGDPPPPGFEDLGYCGLAG